LRYTEACCNDRECPLAALDRGVFSPIVDYLVKDRLTGAIILVVLIVLLVPELLSGPKGPARTLGTSNSAEEQQLRSYTITLGDEAHPHADSASGPAMPQAAQPESSSGGAPSVPDGRSSAGTAAVVPDSVSSAATSAPAATNAASTGVPTSKPTEHSTGATASPVASSSGRTVSSTRGSSAAHGAGAAATRSTATPRSGAATANNGWMVQLGVFASRENAERLAVEVRMKGMHAAVSDVSSSGRRLYRVRVGPAADRASAQDLQSRLKASGHSSGTLIPPS